MTVYNLKLERPWTQTHGQSAWSCTCTADGAMDSWKDDGNRQTSVKGYRVGFWALVLVFPFIFNLAVNLPVRNVTISSSPFLPCNVCLLPGRSQVKCGSLLVPPHLFNQDGHPSPVPHSSVPSCFKEYNVCLLTCFCLCGLYMKM